MSLPKPITQGNLREGLVRSFDFEGWKISNKKAPICNSTEMEKIHKDFDLPPPEMVFGNSHLKLEYKDFELCFSAYDALGMVDTSSTSSEKIKVAYAEEWTRKSSQNHTDIKDVVKPYDWTYTTEYRGTSNKSFEIYQGDSLVDIKRLSTKEPILFYDDNILFEDELADNGTAMLTLRFRVMPSCFLVLQRFFLRVDDVLFRMNDTRIYHEFGSDYIIREYTSKETPYQEIRQKLGRRDISLLNDQNWVASEMTNEPMTLIKEKLLIK